MTNPIKAGDTVTVAEQDYMYGLGELTIRIHGFAQAPDVGPGWVTVRGVEVGRDGRDRAERQIVVRIAGMKRVTP
jgi:hypothetical protein